MTVIAIANPKGGAGKSTTALILGTVFAQQTPTCVVDADPNSPIYDWQGLSNNPLKVIKSRGQDEIVDEVDACRSEYAVTIVDLEGTASAIVSNTLAVADFVIIPIQESSLDSKQAARAINMARTASRITRRPLPIKVLLTRTGAAIVSRDQKAVTAQLTEANIPMFKTELVQRVAYRAIFNYRLALEELDPSLVSGIPAAIRNANLFVAEVAEWIRSQRSVANEGAHANVQ